MNRAPHRMAMPGPGLVVLLALAGCVRGDAPAPAVLAPLERDGGRMDWAGVQPCADCEAIDTRLALSRQAGEGRFVLDETFVAGRPVRFVAEGRWERDDTLLRLEADDGARLVYAVLDDGRLQPRDWRGRRLPGADGDGVLAPVGAPAR